MCGWEPSISIYVQAEAKVWVCTPLIRQWRQNFMYFYLSIRWPSGSRSGRLSPWKEAEGRNQKVGRMSHRARPNALRGKKSFLNAYGNRTSTPRSTSPKPSHTDCTTRVNLVTVNSRLQCLPRITWFPSTDVYQRGRTSTRADTLTCSNRCKPQTGKFPQAERLI